MKKVELITLQRVPNYGSVLQCFATQKVINGLGYECETIDYRPNRMTIKGMLKNIKNKNEKFKKSILLRTIARIIIFPSYLKRFRVFSKFLKQNIKMTSKTFSNNEELKENMPKANVFCTGSDQVWNSEWNGEIDKALFLDFVPNEYKKIAYAASFGKSKLNEDEVEETKKQLAKYSLISMREASGERIIRELGYENVCNVLDPTLLLSGEKWRKIASNRFKNEKYILVYNLNRNPKIDHYAKELARKKNLKIKYLSYQLHEFYKTGKMYCNPKVEDFLALIDNAQYVITDSFHATAFSINFNTEFVIVFPKKFSSRVRDILSLTGLTGRIAKDENDISICNSKIDFKNVNTVIKKERKKSIGWLKEALKEE